jgi:hypothetical protein
MITQPELKNLLHYNEITGIWTWLNTRGNAVNGSRAGSLSKRDGYRRIGIAGKNYLEHRLVFLYVFGKIPMCVDHVNGVRDDNSLSNLRQSSPRENARNARRNSRNTSGYKGVFFEKGKWRARITDKFGIRRHIGYYQTPEQAHKAYCKIASRMYRDFANFG